jgi:RNA polymerase sigma factor (sigma-70 family)
MYSSLSDECLVEIILDGDEDAFTQLYKRYRSKVYSIAFRIIHDPGEAEDAAQEIFVKLYRSLPQWNAKKSKLSTWIYRLSVNHSIDCCRVCSRRAESQLPENNANPIFQLCGTGYSTCSPFKAIKNKEEISLIQRHIEKLPDLQRRTFIGRYFKELKLVEIAEKERLNIGAVKSSLYRATHVVRRVFINSKDFSFGKAELQA